MGVEFNDSTGSKLKYWALLFRDYLSSNANPQKGQAQVFSDSDIGVYLRL